MVTRRLRLSPEFLEDFAALSRNPEWREKVRDGTYRVVMTVSHDDGYAMNVPVKVDRDEEDDFLTIEWEVTPEEDQFERLVFSKLREQ